MNGSKIYSAADGLPQFTLVRKNIKRIYIRLDKEGGLLVSAPVRTPLKEIRKIIADNMEWVSNAVKRREQRTAERPTARNGGSVLIAGQLYSLSVGESKRASCKFAGAEVIAALPEPQNEEAVKALLEKFLRNQAEILFEESLQRMYPLIKPLGAPMPTLKIRKMTSRWGSCNTQTHVITMNLCLARAPLPLIDSVMLHELVHLVNRPHDAHFHAISAGLMPDYLERKKKLNALDIVY